MLKYRQFPIYDEEVTSRAVAKGRRPGSSVLSLCGFEKAENARQRRFVGLETAVHAIDALRVGSEDGGTGDLEPLAVLFRRKPRTQFLYHWPSLQGARRR